MRRGIGVYLICQRAGFNQLFFALIMKQVRKMRDAGVQPVTFYVCYVSNRTSCTIIIY